MKDFNRISILNFPKTTRVHWCLREFDHFEKKERANDIACITCSIQQLLMFQSKLHLIEQLNLRVVSIVGTLEGGGNTVVREGGDYILYFTARVGICSRTIPHDRVLQLHVTKYETKLSCLDFTCVPDSFPRFLILQSFLRVAINIEHKIISILMIYLTGDSEVMV